MSEATTALLPDLVIAFGPRSLLAVVGAVSIVAGVWFADRTWDEKGSHAYERAQTALLIAENNKSGGGDGAVEIPERDLNAAFPFPWAFLLGWVIYGVSNLFVVGGVAYDVDAFDINARSVASLVISLALGWIASVPMGEAVRFRDAAKKQKLSVMFLASWLLLTVVGGPANDSLLLVFRALGAIMIIASMKVLWKFRKMGDTWEQQGIPNPNPVVYNAGGPMFVFGWFLFVVGMAATSESSVAGIPIYFTLRSALAFLTGCGMVPVVLLVDYSHDEGGEFTGTFGTDGRFFGRFWESPIPFVTAWSLFGFSALLPLGNGIASVTTLQWIILANCFLQGIDAGILIQTALYKGDMAGKNKWSIPFVLLFLALSIEIGLGAGGLAWFSLLGAFFIVLGQKTVFGDRKRGDYWMENGVDNPNPIVYSYGEPFFMLGWIIFSLAMAIPTH